MPNQYSGSLEHKIKDRYDCTAEELLRRFSNEGLSYSDVKNELRVTISTIRKWTKRFGIVLQTPQKEAEELEWQRKIDLFKERHINKYNLLSRKWKDIA